MASAKSVIEIRRATRKDIKTIFAFIRELAKYEKLSHQVTTNEKTLKKYLFGPRAYAECLIAKVNGKAAGFALFFHNFSSFLGKPGLYLEDLYVKPTHRGRAVGFKLLQALAKVALDRDCERMEWAVLDWNDPALQFYKKLGAKPQSGWTVQRLSGTAIKMLANTKRLKTKKKL